MNHLSPDHPLVHRLRLTVALQDVLAHVKPLPTNAPPHRDLTLGLIIETTGERSFGVLMAFLCLPFLTPVPLPGLSIPFGLALVLLGAQLAIRKHRPWLPSRLMRLRLPPKVGPRLIAFVAKLFRPLEKIIRPRLLFMQNRVAMMMVGAALMVDGLLLSLPLPPIIPLSNALPAWMALIKILGITEEDGVSLLTGSILSAAAVTGAIVLVVLSWTQIVNWWH